VIDATWIFLLLWVQPYYSGQSGQFEVRCYEWAGRVYQLDIDWSSYDEFMAGSRPQIVQGQDNSFCTQGICHGG
jgi:hypothetical protein